MRLRLWQVLALAALAAASPALAQTPNVRGQVRTPDSVAISGIEVRIEGTTRSTRTDQAGAFAFVGAPKGAISLRFRGLGFLPAALAVHVPEESDTLTVTMLRTTPALDTIRVTAQLHVIAGIVVDSANQPVEGASVDVNGRENASATTDARGWFTFTSVRSGPVVLRIRKAGFEQALHSMRLEDWRGLMIRLSPLSANLSASRQLERSGFGNSTMFVWHETHQRLAMRGVRAAVVPREELAALGAMPLGQAIRQTRSGLFAMADVPPTRDWVCVLQDGRRIVGYTSLDAFHASDVEFVELYPPGSETSGSVAGYLKDAGCQGTRVGARMRGPYYAVVWLRS